MPNTYTALIRRTDDWWIGWFEEIPGANAQERTREELLESLREVLGEMIALNREEAVENLEPESYEEVAVRPDPRSGSDAGGSYTAVVWREDEWWLGRVAEVPGVNCQERTRNGLMASVREVLAELIELNREAATRNLGDHEKVAVALPSREAARAA